VLGGANSDTFVAYHEGFGRWVFQRMVRMEGASDALAFREPRLLDAISHKNIVPVLDAQWDEVGHGWICFVMPYYEAGSIRSCLETGYRFPIHQAIDVICGALAGLAHLHSVYRYIHRDICVDRRAADENHCPAPLNRASCCRSCCTAASSWP
jgi:Protein kinase domain